MKTVILCGGKGRRLERETEYKPKPLIEIGGKPILWHIMKTYSHQGFQDFILCLGYKGNAINWTTNKSTLQINNLDKPLRIKYNQISNNDNFKSNTVTFDKAPIYLEQQEKDITPFETDITDLVTRPDEYSGTLMLAKCDIEEGSELYTKFDNTDTSLRTEAHWDELNGSSWTTTSLTSFTLTNNSSVMQVCESNEISLSEGETLRIYTNNNDIIVRVVTTYVSPASISYKWAVDLYNTGGIVEYNAQKSENVKVQLVGGNGSYDIDISIKKV